MNKLIKLGLVLTAAVSLTSCNIDFNGIGKDDEGNDIPLLLLDLPACDVHYTFAAINAEDGTPLTGAFTARIIPNPQEAGGLANPDQILVTDAMKVSLQHDFTRSLELSLNPNIKVSQDNPVGFTIVAEGPFLNYVGIPVYVRNTEKGKREVALELLNLNQIYAGDMGNGLLKKLDKKGVNPDVSLSGASTNALKFLNRIMGNGYVIQGLYSASSSGTVTANCTNPAFSDYGIVLLTDDLSGAPRRSAIVVNGQIFFVVKRPANILNGKIAFDVYSATKASTSFKYSVETSIGTFTGVFRNTVPFTKQYIEQLFAFSTSKGAVLTLTPSADFSMVGSQVRDITDITVNGGGVADPAYEVSKQANLVQYKIKLIGTCATDRKISMAPSKSFSYRKTGTTEWLRGEMVAGQATLLLENGADYDFGVYFDGQLYQYPFTTTRENIQNVLSNQYVEKYTLNQQADGSFNISVTVVAPEICDLTGDN